MFSSKLVEQFYCSSTYADITTTEYSGELNKCGDQITFFRSPRVRIRRGQKDSTIKHDTIDTCPITLTIDKELEFSVKIAKIDVKQICNWDAWQSSLLKSASYNIGEAIDQELLAQMYVEADPTNKGATAGIRTRSYNLGSVGAPVAITSDNIWQVLTQVAGVLREQCLPMEDLFIVLPDVALPVLLNSPMLSANAGLAGACCEVASNAILNGKIPAKIAGFDVYISHNVFSTDDNGDVVYEIVAGWRGATAFAMQIEDTRIIDNDKDSWDIYLQGMTVYGSKVIQAEGLAGLYATFA
jgi:hypothetical protein